MSSNPKDLWEEMLEAAREELGDGVSPETVITCIFICLLFMLFFLVAISGMTYPILLVFGLKLHFGLWMLVNIPIAVFVGDAIEEWATKNF